MGTVAALSALSLVVVTAESSLLNPIKNWYSEFSLPIEISGTGIANSMDESFYLAKTKVDAVIANPGGGPGTPIFDPYASVLGFTEFDFLVTLIVIAGMGAAMSLPLFIMSFRQSKKNSLLYSPKK